MNRLRILAVVASLLLVSAAVAAAAGPPPDAAQGGLERAADAAGRTVPAAHAAGSGQVDVDEDEDEDQDEDQGGPPEGTHGFDVSRAAHECEKGPGGVHGECVSEVARDNHGHSGEHGKPDDAGKPAKPGKPDDAGRPDPVPPVRDGGD